MPKESEKSAEELVEMLLGELEHIHNTLEFCVQNFIYEQKLHEASVMHSMCMYIRALRADFDEKLSKIMYKKSE